MYLHHHYTDYAINVRNQYTDYALDVHNHYIDGHTLYTKHDIDQGISSSLRGVCVLA